MHRAKGLLFCKLENTTIVLEPCQGKYFILSHAAAEFLESLPEEGFPNKEEHNRESSDLFSKNQSNQFYNALLNAQLIYDDINAKGVWHQQLCTLSSESVREWGLVTQLTHGSFGSLGS